jgi:superfamily II DNA or RNA helicase
MTGGDLTKRKWKRFLRASDGTLVEQLYEPALAEAARYDRCCAYFSSTALAVAARGFGKLIERLARGKSSSGEPPVRLLVNEEMSREDARALTDGSDTSALENLLTARLSTPAEALERRRLAMLGLMVQRGWLEVRVGFMRGGGILHAKFGIIYDDADNALVFRGSANETASGLRKNYEDVEVSPSWDDPGALRHYSEDFERLWKNESPDVETYPLPEAVRLELIRFVELDPDVASLDYSAAPALSEVECTQIRRRAAMLWRFLVESPYLPGDAGLATCDATTILESTWPHQRRVISETTAAWPDGRLLCDEVGMGKTVEAILILRRLLAGRGVRRALLLLPAGLLRQWQAELREKGGMVFPRLLGNDRLVWPDGREEDRGSLAAALKESVVIVSREFARLEANRAVFLAAEPWDLVLLDESHAARRKSQKEGAFNEANLVLNLLRELQLTGATRGILLLSATPMQTQPWEPWDLLGVLGQGGPWLAEFRAVRNYYAAIAAIRSGPCPADIAHPAAAVILSDEDFGNRWSGPVLPHDLNALAKRLMFVAPTERESFARALRAASPLSARMHRNTRHTLRRYYEMGLLADPPPVRDVQDVAYDYDLQAERDIYKALAKYIEQRFKELEEEKPGKGFVMTIYRRRMASSPFAIRRSLERRRDGLLRVIKKHAPDIQAAGGDLPEALNLFDDLGDDDDSAEISPGLPDDPDIAMRELRNVDSLLEDLDDLKNSDTKRDRFRDVLQQVTSDGRAALVFTEYTDTLLYLRDYLHLLHGDGLGCYSGDGGLVSEGGEWKSVTKDDITKALRTGKLRVLLCTDAASEGLNLQTAGVVLNYDLPWNPSKVEQRIGRIDRIGQKLRQIRVVNFFLQDSVDQRVYLVLQERCGLFRNYVGSMQPVLAEAQRMLMGRLPEDTEFLRKLASQQISNPVTAELFPDDEASPLRDTVPAASRSDLASAIETLGTLPLGFRTTCERPGTRLSFPDGTSIALSFEAAELERANRLLPASPFLPELRSIADLLSETGEHLPLICGTAEDGAFRACVCKWVSPEGPKDVRNVAQLQTLIEEWDGIEPSAELWRDALRDAENEARTIVESAKQRLENSLKHTKESQIAAARRRLTLELGRFLVCLGAGSDTLNSVFYEQMNREHATAARLMRCYARFENDYPDWTPELRSELLRFAGEVTANQRAGRLIGSELDAALDDPRWNAA